MKKHLASILALSAVLALGGCGGGPSGQDIRDLALTAATGRNPQGWEFGQFNIFNSYRKTIDNETVHFFEIEMTLKKTDGSTIPDYGQPESPVIRYKIALVKEGNEWRYLMDRDMTGPMPK